MFPPDFPMPLDLSQPSSSNEELKNIYPFALCSAEGSILFANPAFSKYILEQGAKSVAELNSDPPLTDLIRNFYSNEALNLIFDIALLEPKFPEADTFQVYAEKIKSGKESQVVLFFSSELRLREIETKVNDFYQALDIGEIPVIFADSRGLVRYSTKTFERILGKKIDSLYGTTLPEAFSEKFGGDELLSFTKALYEQREWTGIALANNENKADVYWEIKVHPLLKSLGDNLKFALTAHDITDFIIKGRLAKESEKRLRAIINNISDLLIIIKEEGGVFLYEASNINFSSVFDLNRESSYHRPVEELLHSSLIEKISASVEEIANGSSETGKFEYYNYADRKEYSGKTARTKDPFDGSSLYITSLKDISEEKLLQRRLKYAYEKEQAINKLKTSFLENMSHEVRTPLNAVVGYSDLLEGDIKDGEYSSALEMIGYLKDGVKRLLNFVDNIIEVSLIESAEISLDFGKIPVNSVIENLCLKMSKFAETKGIYFKWDLEPSDPCARLDENKFSKLMMDIIENAIKYTQEGGVTIRSFVEDGLVKIEVQDTGIGIKEENLMHILEPFAQEDMGSKRNYEGAGLGLTIAYKLTRLMGGAFVIESQKNKGTIISLAYPAVS